MNDSYRLSNLQRTSTRLPWVTFLFLAAVFFITKHKLFFSLEENFNMPAEFFISATISGSLKRRIAFLSLGLFGLISLMLQRRSRLKINGFLGWLILFYLVWAFSSLVWAEDIALSFRRLVLLFMVCIGALAVAKNFSVREIILFAFFSTTLYLIIGLLAEIALGTFNPSQAEYRFAGTIHPNSQGLNCALLLLAAVCLAGSANRGRSFFLAIVIVALIFLIITKSRTAFASALLALFVYLALVSSIKRKLTLILGVSLTFCLLLLLVGDAFFPALRQGILLGREDPTVNTLTGRIPLWKDCMEYFAQRPFIGYGYGSFWTPRHIHELSYMHGREVGEGHSTYLELLLNLGSIGMISFVLIFILGVIKSFKHLKVSGNIEYAFLCSLLVFCLLDGLLESATFQPNFITFISMVALAHLAFVIPEHEKIRIKNRSIN